MSINYNMDRQFTYTELSKQKDIYIKIIDDFIGKAVLLAKKNKGKNVLKIQIDQENTKKESEFMEYMTPEQVIYRRWEYNREHKLDTVLLNEFNKKNDSEIEKVKISYGPASDEYVRQNHALALTVGTTIYFRNGAYKPETEEGRKLLAHELTHIAQNNEIDKYRNSTVEEKEQEAESNEKLMEYNPDPEITVRINGKYKKIRKSKLKKTIDEIADVQLERINNEYQQQNSLEDQLKYLIDLDEKMAQGEIKWLQ